MEMGEQLVGVTMNEPGVSRIVEVDIHAAKRFAAAPCTGGSINAMPNFKPKHWRGGQAKNVWKARQIWSLCNERFVNRFGHRRGSAGAGVMGYNYWQESRHKKNVERAFGDTAEAHEDVDGPAGGAPSETCAMTSKRAIAPRWPMCPPCRWPCPAWMPRSSMGKSIPLFWCWPIRRCPSSVSGRRWSARVGSDEIRWEGLVDGVGTPVDDNTDDEAAYRELRVGP